MSLAPPLDDAVEELNLYRSSANGDEASSAPVPPAKQRRLPRLFVPTMSATQVRRLAPLPGRAWLLYVALLVRCKVDHKSTVTLTTEFLALFGASRSDKSRGLADLEGAGLVRVERQSRRNPLVTVLPVPPGPEEEDVPDQDRP